MEIVQADGGFVAVDRELDVAIWGKNEQAARRRFKNKAQRRRASLKRGAIILWRKDA